PSALRLFGLIHMARRSKVRVRWLGCPIVLSPTWQIGLFRLGQITEMTFGCPIASQQTQHIPLFPQCGAQKGEETAETMAPIGEERQIAQQQINQQRRPHLPAHRIGRGAQEVGQLQSLFDLLKKTSICQRQRYNATMLSALHSKLLVRNSIGRSSPSTSTSTTMRRNSTG